MYGLIVEHQDQRVEKLELGRGNTTIGRRHGNMIRLLDPKVSGEHARIVWFYNKPYIQDLNSTNGTFVNGRRITGEHTLMDGDVITIGDNSIKFIQAETLPGHRKATDSTYATANNHDFEVLLERLPIPDSIQWFAQDAAGYWWGFEEKPRRTEQGWVETNMSNFIKLAKGEPNPDWANSLRPRPPETPDKAAP